MQAEDIYELKAKIVVMVQRALLEHVLGQSGLTHLQVVQEVVAEVAAPVDEEQEVVVVQEKSGGS